LKEAVVLDRVWVKFDQVVLEDISLTVQERHILSVVGPNGSGKTTLLKAILGLKDPYRGSIRVFGEEPRRAGRGVVGYLPQMNSIEPNFPVSAYDMVAFSRFAGKSLWPLLQKSEKNLVKDALERVQMGHLAERHFGSLSGGQKQRVLIARALVLKPKILILDEPSTGLDAVAQDQFYAMLRTFRDADGMTILIVSHDIGAVSGIVDEIACLNRKIHFHGRPSETIRYDALEKVFGKDIRFVFHDSNCLTCRKDS
jgi:zinc transport system ATP-binding protein